ncbi:uncharacterized protein LDX57_007015 [Aspergillus melleus]|uniref:uncharacterized protein n=1 Tax=Aspergillus melleus TaxID=138277 RepID=UPI001E8DABBF|nr:uncharacterized protein LDX57_007015 [Aspergillus melleus]KAH8429349.1 hypothetical protein LDX57_007015 [Aspergillus melleus]
MKVLQDLLGPDVCPLEASTWRFNISPDPTTCYWDAFETYTILLQGVFTREAREEEANHLMIWAKHKIIWTHVKLPEMLIRLNRDWDAWALIRDWNLDQVRRAGKYNSEMFFTCAEIGPLDELHSLFEFHARQHTVLATLIKIKILLDLQAVDEARFAVGCKLPQELLAIILSYVPSTDIIAKDQDLAYHGHWLKIRLLQQQIRYLFRRTLEECGDTWDYILHGCFPEAPTCKCIEDRLIPGEKCIWDDEADAYFLRVPWLEAPGALDYLERLINAPRILPSNYVSVSQLGKRRPEHMS